MVALHFWRPGFLEGLAVTRTNLLVVLWMLGARRLINKDIRKKIGMLIWEARHLAEYAQVRSKTEQNGCAIS